MSGARYAEMVGRLVRRMRSEPSPRLPSDRRRLVGAVEEALRARARRNATVRTAWTASAAAAVLLVVGGAGLWWRGQPAAPVGGVAVHEHPLTVLAAAGEAHAEAGAGAANPMALRSGMTIGAGIRLVAPPSGEVRVGTAEGTALTLEPGSDLTVADASDTQRFALHEGALRLKVARLTVGQRFVVDTDDAEIEVHGTAFRVAVVDAESSCGHGTKTRVSVTEGVVTVRAGGEEVRLSPGQEWPSDCASSPARAHRVARHAAVRPPAARAVAAPAAAAESEPAAVVATPPAAPASVLAAQNDLFAAAARARNQGRADESLRLFEKLVQDYPDSPLVESALVQRMKLLAARDRAAGARAAREYLARFPAGFARLDASKLVERAGE